METMFKNMWERTSCCICRATFSVHPNAKTFETRQMCLPCRKVVSRRDANG